MIKKLTDNKKIFMCLLIIFFILIYIFNYLTPLLDDDYTYQFIYMGRYPKGNKEIQTIYDIFISMYNHYFLWGGRIVNHFLLQLIFMFGITFFNLFNTFMYILLGILIYKHVVNEKKYNCFLISFIYIFIFLFSPTPVYTFLWKSGSANYLWSTNLILIMTLIYKKNYDKPVKDSWLNIILLFIYGLIVGCTNENTGCALIIVNLLFIYFNNKKGNNCKWLKFNLVGIIIGYLILLLAPGNYNRNIIYPQGVYDSIFSFIIEFLFINIMSLIMVIVCLIFTFLIIKKYKINYDSKISLIYIVFSLIASLSMIASPVVFARSFFFSFVYLFIVLLKNILVITKNINIKGLYYIYIAFSIIFIIIYSIEFINLYKFYHKVDETNKFILNEVKKGKQYIEVEYESGICTSNYLSCESYLNDWNDLWNNSWIAYYNNAKIIIVNKTLIIKTR